MRLALLAAILMVPAELRADPPEFVYADYGVLCTPGALRACSSIQIQAQRDPITGAADVFLWVSNTSNSMISQINLFSVLERDPYGPDFSPFPCVDVYCITRVKYPWHSNYISTDEGVHVQGDPYFSLSGLKGGPTREFPLEMATSGVTGCGSSPAVADYYQTCGARVRLNFTGMFTEALAGPQFPGAFLDELAMGTIGVSVEFGDDLRCANILDTEHYSYRADILCESFPSTVTPEPGTLILVGTGIAGMFGVARRRRRGLQDAGD
jgi:hypothetical protein